jgi:hypothetical protein
VLKLGNRKNVVVVLEGEAVLDVRRSGHWKLILWSFIPLNSCL